jgi:DNA-binding transcriptional MerR regulator
MDEIDRLLPSALYPRVEPSDELITIGVFARRSRLSMKALRLYERHGLLVPARVDDHNGYRYYREQQLGTARLIAQLRRLDMPLAEVAAVLAESGERRAELLHSYWDEVERRIASQRELAAHLQMRISGADPVSGEIRERDQPARLVITEQRRVGVDELAGWLGRAMWRLAGSAGEYGGIVAPQFVVYHGEVNQDSDGPVEICTPIDPAVDVAGAVPVRREPAHREVYLRLRKAQVGYPQILSTFDSLAAWLAREGINPSAPPREIYFTDFISAAATDEVCDVAFPI